MRSVFAATILGLAAANYTGPVGPVCAYDGATVPHGAHVQGLGAEFCNLWTCNEGVFDKTQRNCDQPIKWTAQPAGIEDPACHSSSVHQSTCAF
jgi:hypothetical protein